jgi:plasmid stabilization system protein ParE
VRTSGTTVLVLAALAAGAVPAVVDLGAAKRELWSTLVAVEEVRATLRGLQAIAGDSQAYDVAVAGELRERAEQDLRRAEQHLGRIWRLPGQDDETLKKVAAAQDELRKLRERVQRLGRGTRTLVDPRPDLRQGAAGRPPSPPTRDDSWMPPPGSAALQDMIAGLKAVQRDLETAPADLRALGNAYQVAGELPQP